MRLKEKYKLDLMGKNIYTVLFKKIYFWGYITIEYLNGGYSLTDI